MQCPNCGIELNEGVCWKCGYTAPEPEESSETVADADTKEPKKKGKRRKLFWGVGILLLLVAIIVGGRVIFQTGGATTKRSSGNQMVYIHDEKVYYVQDVTKEKEPIEVCSLRIHTDNPYYWEGEAASFSPDGKYMYFYDDYDTDGHTLKRIKVSKISDDVEANKKNIEKIDTDVSYYNLVNQHDVIYLASDALCYYRDKEETVTINEDVSDFYLTDDKAYIIYTIPVDDYGNNNKLYYYSLDTDDGELLDKNVYSIIDAGQADYIIFTKRTEDYERVYNEYSENYEIQTTYTYDLYECSVNAGTETLAEDVYASPDYEEVVCEVADDGSVYYYVEESTTMLDFVDDPYANMDEYMWEPNENDYKTAATVEEILAYLGMEPEEDEELPTPEELYEKIRNRSVYGEEIFYEDEEQQWYFWDDERYHEDLETAEDKEETIEEIRESLSEQSMYSLYKYSDSESQKMAEHLVQPNATINTKENMILYYSWTDFFSMDEWLALFVDDDIDLLNKDVITEYLYDGETRQKILSFTWRNQDAGRAYSSVDGQYIFNRLYEYQDNGEEEIVFQLFKKQEDGTYELIDEENVSDGIDGYYHTVTVLEDGFGVLTNDWDELFCSGLYVTENDKITCIDKSPYAVVGVWNGGILYDSGISKKGSKTIYDLNYWKNGDITEIASDVLESTTGDDAVVLDDDTLLYLDDSTLYFYQLQKAESCKIDSNVDYFYIDTEEKVDDTVGSVYNHAGIVD